MDDSHSQVEILEPGCSEFFSELHGLRTVYGHRNSAFAHDRSVCCLCWYTSKKAVSACAPGCRSLVSFILCWLSSRFSLTVPLCEPTFSVSIRLVYCANVRLLCGRAGFGLDSD